MNQRVATMFVVAKIYQNNYSSETMLDNICDNLSCLKIADST